MGRQQSDAQGLVPRVQIPITIWQKMMGYVLNCPVEINGFGFIEVHRGIIRVNDVFILDQTATPAAVETDEQALGQYVYDLIRQGGDPGAIKFQWHSHVNMAAYFSSVDTDNIDRWVGDWLLSLVANKQGEYSCRLDVLRPIRVGVPVRPEFIADMPLGLLDATANEVSAKVKVVRNGFRRGNRPVELDPLAAASPLHFDPEDIEFFLEEGTHGR